MNSVEIQLTFRRNMSPPSSGSKNKPSKEAELCLPHTFTPGGFSWLILWLWRCRRHIPAKRWLTSNGLHGVISQSQISPSQGCKAKAHLISLCDSETSPLKLWLNPKAVLDVVWMAFPRWSKFFSKWFRFSLPVTNLPTLYIRCYIRDVWHARLEKRYPSPLLGFTSDLTLGRTQSKERECKNDGFVGSRNEIINKVRVVTSVIWSPSPVRFMNNWNH
jgi:hypothetical protein